MPADPHRTTRLAYDRVADRYAAEVGGELVGKPLDRALLAALVELAGDGPVLDAGCGPGHVAAFVDAVGGRALGVDLSPAMAGTGRRSTGLPFAAGDLCALPVATGSVAAVACLYAVIHLDEEGRRAAYAELARVLRPGGHALVAFHVSDADAPPGSDRHLDRWWDVPVDLTFRFLRPEQEAAALAAAGLPVVARVDRAPLPDVEHASERCYLLARAAPSTGHRADR